MLAAAGLAASVAASGLAAPAGAAASSKIYACYSDTTKALYYAKSSTCKSGFTAISWNKQGPQGARGAQGPQGTQGPQGARGAQGSKGTQGAQGSQGSQGAQGRAGAPNAFTRTNKGSKVAIPQSRSAVVASFAPGSSSHAYVIDATATVKQVGNNAGAVVCWDRDVEFGSVTQAQSVSFGFTGWKVPIATNGLLLAGPGNPIEELCRGYGTDASAHGEITVTQLSSGQTSAGTAGQLSARPGTTKPFRPRLRNSYVPPRKRGATFLPRGRAGTKP